MTDREILLEILRVQHSNSLAIGRIISVLASVFTLQSDPKATEDKLIANLGKLTDDLARDTARDWAKKLETIDPAPPANS